MSPEKLSEVLKKIIIWWRFFFALLPSTEHDFLVLFDIMNIIELKMAMKFTIIWQMYNPELLAR